jgi:hypothetical protein
VNDELDAFARCYADLKQTPGLVGADQHCEVTEAEHPDWVVIGVQHVVVTDPVFSGARQDHGIHLVNLA